MSIQAAKGRIPCASITWLGQNCESPHEYQRKKCVCQHHLEPQTVPRCCIHDHSFSLPFWPRADHHNSLPFPIPRLGQALPLTAFQDTKRNTGVVGRSTGDMLDTYSYHIHNIGVSKLGVTFLYQSGSIPKHGTWVTMQHKEQGRRLRLHESLLCHMHYEYLRIIRWTNPGAMTILLNLQVLRLNSSAYISSKKSLVSCQRGGLSLPKHDFVSGIAPIFTKAWKSQHPYHPHQVQDASRNWFQNCCSPLQ